MVVLNDYSFVTRFVAEPLDDVLRNSARGSTDLECQVFPGFFPTAKKRGFEINFVKYIRYITKRQNKMMIRRLQKKS